MSDLLPYPADWTVRRARDAYLAENGFTVAAYDDAWTEASFLGIRFSVPNTQRHRWAIMLHDLHHVATGFGTDLTGEGEISLWELRRGLSALGLYVGGIVASGALMGVFASPRRAWAAFSASGSTPSLFDPNVDYDALLDMTVGELRARLAVPAEGLAREPRGLHAYAPRRVPGGASVTAAAT
ncbi:Hypothetical protein A7982_08831 [Minicystis rosea]|nr:Hypothetical protein A7982_08831 [Minicystis rosea]